MPAITTNEPEFQGDVLSWFRERLVEPFADVTQETGVQGKFPDVVLWKDRNAGLAGASCELKGTETPARDPELIESGNAKAHNLGAVLLLTWNMREAVVWRVQDTGPEELWSYDPVPVRNTKQWRQRADDLRKLAHELVVDMAQFIRDGTPPRTGRPESTVFIEGIHRSVERLVPLYQGLMRAEYSKVLRWCATQTIKSDDDFLTAARHAAYRIVGKLLFYQTLARVRGDLEPIVVPNGQTAAQLQASLHRCFESAKQIDYEALFEEDLPDELPFTDDIAVLITRFCGSFLPLNLPSMQLDIIGRIFESLVPSDEKKSLGQYFTEPWLGDLIVACAIRRKDDLVFDPTCGTGGILLRAYSALKRLGKTKHTALLDALWGNDIGDLPTELAMINMFRQDPQDTANFPRILRRDIFDLHPGMELELTPSRSSGGLTRVTVKMPQFEAVIGNPPYLRRQDLGEGHSDPQAYKNRIWKEFPRYDRFADQYVFIFEKSSRFLKPGGRLCFVTSNAWLDSEYGLELQRFFLENFRLIAVFESRCEPWFENAQVNTVVTVIEKPESIELQSANTLTGALSNHPVPFVKLKKPLMSIVDPPLEDPRRYDKYARLVADVETSSGNFETDSMRVRKVRQGDLHAALPLNGGISKWGIYLRAPNAFLHVLEAKKHLLQNLGDVVVTRFGTLTGKNEFYCPRPNDPPYALFQKVHSNYRLPIVRTIKGCDKYELKKEHCEGELFVCNDPKRRVKGRGTKQYIEWGAKQKDDGNPWPKCGEMKNRDPWYSTRDPVCGDVIFQMFIGNRHCTPINPRKFAVLNNLLAGDARDSGHKILTRCILNSTWFALCCELYGRVNLGGGALKIEKVDLDIMPLPRFDFFSKNDVAKVKKAFGEMKKRPALPIEEELKQRDRQALDAVVFKVLELGKDRQQEIYDAVVSLAHERHYLAKLRKLRTSARVVRDVSVVVEDIVASVMPDGFRRFPEDFVTPREGWRQMPVPKSGLEVVAAPAAPGQADLFCGEAKYVLEGDDGYVQDVLEPEYVDYLYYAQDGTSRRIYVPPDNGEAREAVKRYQEYVLQTKRMIRKAVFERVLDGRRADEIVKRILNENFIYDEPIRVTPKRSRRGVDQLIAGVVRPSEKIS